MKSIRIWTFLLAVAILTNGGMGADILFEITPETIMPLLTPNLTLRCSLNNPPISSTAPPSNSNMSLLNSIAITKDGVDVAAVSQQISAKVFGNSTDVEVTGQLSGNTGFLQLVYRYPTGQKSGAYVCDVSTVDQRGHGHILTKSLNVMEKDMNYMDLIAEFHELKMDKEKMDTIVDNLLATVNDLLNTTNEQKITITDQRNLIDGLRNTNNWQNHSLSVINQKLTDQNNLIDGLSQKLTSVQLIQNTHIYFSVALANHLTVAHDAPAIFDTVLSNVGGGYNPSTGQFICPQAGVYQFFVHVMSQSNQNADLVMYHNNHTRYVVNAYAVDGFDRNTDSVTAVLSLAKGDTIRLFADNPSYLFGDGFLDCRFTGILLYLT